MTIGIRRKQVDPVDFARSLANRSHDQVEVLAARIELKRAKRRTGDSQIPNDNPRGGRWSIVTGRCDCVRLVEF
jgi:hypothetical protein